MRTNIFTLERYILSKVYCNISCHITGNRTFNFNKTSAYIRWGAHTAAFTDAGSAVNAAAGSSFVTGSAAITVSLSGATSDDAPTVGELSTAYDMYDDSETVDVNLLIGPETGVADDVTMANYLIAIAEGRKDCVVFVSPAVAATVNNASSATDVKAWADAAVMREG